MAEYHRLIRVVEHVPWADANERPSLMPLLSRYLRQTAPRLLNRDEALAFCRFVEAEPNPSPAYLPELARHERVRLEMAWGLSGALSSRVEAFTYPVLRILSQLSGPGWPHVMPEPSHLEFKKVPGLPAVLIRAQPRE